MQLLDKELRVRGRLIRIAKLRHEWYDFFANPVDAVRTLQRGAAVADLLTFVQDISDDTRDYPFYSEPASAAVLTITSHQSWWEHLDFRVRNKIRKAVKNGVEVRNAKLDEKFAAGVELIYNESPIRQGRPFGYYGYDAAAIYQDLRSLLDRCYFVGAYCGDELLGFAKLFHGNGILRTVHIIAKLAHRDKPVQDALIERAVQICEDKGIQHLQYGSWSEGGLGVFKIKHGFRKFDYSRYYVPLTYRGSVALRFRLHQGVRGWLSDDWVTSLRSMRNTWNKSRYSRLLRMPGPWQTAREQTTF
jgi:hypothetical protein